MPENIFFNIGNMGKVAMRGYPVPAYRKLVFGGSAQENKPLAAAQKERTPLEGAFFHHPRSTFDRVHCQPSARGLLVLVLHVPPGIAHGANRLVK